MTRPEFTPLFKQFAELKGLRVTDLQMELWYAAFKGLSREEMLVALARYAKESTEFPSPAEVLKFAGVHGLTDERRAESSWGAVRQAVRAYGYNSAIEFDDPIIHAAIRMMGGWDTLCNLETGKIDYKRTEFIRCYTTCARTGLGDGRPFSGLGESPVEKITVGLPEHVVGQKLLEKQRRTNTPVPVTLIPDFGVKT